MKNNYFLSKSIGLSLLSALFVVEKSNAEKRPNILFAFADDWGRHAGIYHEKENDNLLSSIVSTPNIDKLAREGALFMNAHVCAPSSTPCRSALLSGQYFWQTTRASMLHGSVWESSYLSYPLILQENGYHIGRTYKVWNPGTPANAPYGGNLNKFEAHGTAFNSFSLNVSAKTNQTAIEAEKQRLYNEVIGNFQDFLNARPDNDTPFCYWWGPTNTHREWKKGSGKAIWGIEPNDLIGKLPPIYPDVAAIREDIADYLGEIQAFDHALGLIIEELEKQGELDNTIIVVSGDHGMAFPRAKSNLYNLGTQVALIAHYPKMIKSGRIIDDFVNLMDLAPTFLELGGVTPPEAMTGESLVPIFKAEESGQIEASRTFVVTGLERHNPGARDGNMHYPKRAITTAEYKYIRNFEPERWPMGPESRNFQDVANGPSKTWLLNNYCNENYKTQMNLIFGKRPYEELYDLTSDPYEMNNLAEDANFETIKKELSEKLNEVLINTNDPRMQPGLCIFERYPYTVSGNE